MAKSHFGSLYSALRHRSELGRYSWLIYFSTCFYYIIIIQLVSYERENREKKNNVWIISKGNRGGVQSRRFNLNKQIQIFWKPNSTVSDQAMILLQEMAEF